jgi:hypothetical protein
VNRSSYLRLSCHEPSPRLSLRPSNCSPHFSSVFLTRTIYVSRKTRCSQGHATGPSPHHDRLLITSVRISVLRTCPCLMLPYLSHRHNSSMSYTEEHLAKLTNYVFAASILFNFLSPYFGQTLPIDTLFPDTPNRHAKFNFKFVAQYLLFTAPTCFGHVILPSSRS